MCGDLASIGSCVLYQLFKDFAGPIATIIASFAAAFVAWRMGRTQADISKSQLRTSCEKLRLDLFEKRYAVYVAVRDFIGVINRDANLHDDADLVKFEIAAADACFLFRYELEEYLSYLRNRAIKLKVLRKEHQTRQQSAQLPIENYQDHLMALLKSFDDELSKLKECFRPYLGFKDIV